MNYQKITDNLLLDKSWLKFVFSHIYIVGTRWSGITDSD